MTKYNTVSPGIQRYGENHPMVSLILLLAMVFGGAIIFGMLALFIGLALADGAEGLGNLEKLLSGDAPNANFLKIFQAVSSIGTFVLPALLMSTVEKRRYHYLNFNAPVNPMQWFTIIGIMFFAAPVFEQSIKLNEQMQLPEALAGLEQWMKSKETEMELLTKQLLADTSYWGLFINLVIVAVIPAIGEEFVFRGCVQQILTRWFKNPHIAIWITAIVFSAIHLQFYGFLPRMLLGALFGYLLLWGRNIWLPVLAHFLNNAAATVSAFYLQRQGKSLDEMDFGDQIPIYLYFVSFALTAVLIYQYRKTATVTNTRHYGKRLD